MTKPILTHLWSALDFSLSEVFRADFLLGVAGGAGAAALALVTPDALLRSVPDAAVLIGVIIGTVIAGVAVQTAFMDQAFLRKIRAIDQNPVRYVSPFMFTAVIAVFAIVGIIILSTLSDKSPAALLGVISGLTGFFAIWAIISLLYCLATLVQFMGLKVDALDVPDDPGEIEAARKTLRDTKASKGQIGEGRNK
jgi:uncharacterized membrane protein